MSSIDAVFKGISDQIMEGNYVASYPELLGLPLESRTPQ